MMADGLTQDEKREVNTFLEKINKYREVESKEPITWNTAAKFLMARKFDQSRAVELYMNHEITREKEDLTHVDPEDDSLQKELTTEKLTILRGRDKHGASIALFTARYHTPSCSPHRLVLKALIYQLDAALESYDTQRHGLVFIYDMTGSKYGNFDYELSIKILNMLKGGYPARLKKVLIVTAPLWFKAPFKILRLFVREKLRDRVFTVNTQQLLEHIPHEALPKKLGGSATTNHKAWLKMCLMVATNQNPNMETYFLTYNRKTSPNDINARGTISQRSLSTDGSETIFVSDVDSEESKETVNEKHNCEDKEKEDMIADHEKEVTVEKEEVSPTTEHVKRKHESDHSSEGDSSKRTADEMQVDTCSANEEDCEELPRKKKAPSEFTYNIYEEDSLHMPEDGGMNLETLVQHVQTLRQKGLYHEYASIKMEPPAGTFVASKAKYNLPKNRYSDVLSFDHSRVKLPQVDGDPSSDYINANYVDGYMQKQAFISTQGPLPRTFGDFWRMVWQCQVLVVVMTTRAVERGRTKCGQYWPCEEEAENQFDEFIVINTGIEQHHDYIITGLFLHNTKTGESRHLTHLQFISWPDYGVPRSAAAFLDFLFRVRSCQSEATKNLGNLWQGHPNGPPIVVHCSAGIGRTGTFMTMDITLRRLEHIGTVDVQETVRRIRSQRAFSIQMPDQYVFCHLAVIEHAVRQDLLSEVNWAGFTDSSSESDDD